MNSLFQNEGRNLHIILAALLCFAMIPATAFAADVDVYAEGAYTDTDLVICIYADINNNEEAILSFGVKVNYPASMTFNSATKNEAVWYFGNDTIKHPYMDPQDDGTGVLIIGGKLNTDYPTEGVSGTRVLLGKVTFTLAAGATNFTDISLTYGRGNGAGEYKNFVTTDGAVKDGSGVEFTAIKIAKLGDANINGIIDTGDMFVVRTYIQQGKYSCIADCNKNGLMDTGDMFCIKGEIGG